MPRATFIGLILGVLVASSPLFAQTMRVVENIYYRESRPENSYHIERSYDDAVCRDVLQRLNKAYRMPIGLRMPSDYAEIEAHYYLGSDENVRWTKKDFQFANAVAPADLAEIDLFNSGHSSTVLRRVWSVSSTLHYRLHLANLRDGRWSATEVGINYSRERNRRINPSLSTGFSFPVLDIITSGGRNYLLLKPIRDVIPDARVYVLRLYGVLPNAGGAADYELMCTMMTR